ncbi:MAG: hypothetical protein ACTSVY_15300 [Candidatus Helarchaeota archaeon]
MHEIRKILGLEKKGNLLITGFGEFKEGYDEIYKIPDRAFKLLTKQNIKIAKIYCFTTPKARKTREDYAMKEDSENLVEIDKFFDKYIYTDYRNEDSGFVEEIINILKEEIGNFDIYLDLTPLTKLYTIKILEISEKYNIPSFYLGEKESKSYIFWKIKN